MAILTGLALNSSIADYSECSRKNYFYPDLPKGYQISQYDKPLCYNGYLDIYGTGPAPRRIGITRIHIEEDAGKLIHDQDIDTLLDVNRCGAPLIEIVTEPDLRTAQEAYLFLTSIKQILQYLNVSDCSMEEGSLRCDVNVSIRPQAQKRLGVKTELKNMNSFHGVLKALEYEIARQTEIIESGGTVIQQTFLWDPARQITIAMRSKEDAHDYRYFPEPDLMPVIVDTPFLERIRSRLPELPHARRQRFIEHYGLNAEHASVLTGSRSVADYFEQTATACGNVKLAASWIMGELLRVINEQQIPFEKINLQPHRLGALLNLIHEGTISALAAKKVFDQLLVTDAPPMTIVETLGLSQISGTQELEAAIRQVLDDNPRELERYKAGETKLLAFFVGQTMKVTKGKGNPKQINVLLSALVHERGEKDAL